MLLHLILFAKRDKTNLSLKNVICELIAQIAGITSDFKMDGIMLETWL